MNRIAFALVLLLPACSSEPSGPAAVVDSGVIDSGADAPTVVDSSDASPTCTPPPGANTLGGEFSIGSPGGEPAWAPKAVYRIERAKDPAHPQIMFLSSAVECAAMKEEGYAGTIPPTKMLFIELGKAAPGEYPASKTTPPPSNAVYVYTWGSYTPPNPPAESQYSSNGSVTITSHDSSMTSGTFFADFITDPPNAVRVCGRFEAKPCAVNW